MENYQVGHETARVLDDVTQKIKDSPALKQWVMSEQGKEAVREWKAEQRRITAVNASDLMEMDVPPIQWIVKDMLPVGLAILGAPSKYFKSYMALDMCISICKGRKFLGFDTVKSGCCYMDLESTRRRPKARLKQILKDEEAPENLYIITGENEPGMIGQGFEDTVFDQIKQHPEIKLVVVDVFQMVRAPAKNNQNGYDRDYADFKALKHTADQLGICILLIHHTRKMRDDSDVFNMLSGSVGMLGAMDAALLITKDKRVDDDATLHITGRDMESKQAKIKFNKSTFRWEYLGDAVELEEQRQFFQYDQNAITLTIRKLVEQGSGSWEGSAEDIKQASRLFNIAYKMPEIYDDPAMVGKFISKYMSYFGNVDGIRVDTGRRGHSGKRVYIFTDSNVSSDSNVSKQIEIEEMFK